LNDEINLVLPAQEDFRHIAHLVMGGLGVRLELTYEQLEDLQVALEALLACRDDADDISIAVVVDKRAVRTTVGPFAADALAELKQDASSLGLRRVLDTVSDRVRVDERDGASYVELTKETVAS
jgi:anti-sigma regulatory factor (Ser/Thr protein kinase)